VNTHIIELTEEILRLDQQRKQWKEVFQYWMGKEIIYIKNKLQNIDKITQEEITEFYNSLKKIENIIYGEPKEELSRFEIGVLIERTNKFKNYLKNKYPEAQQKKVSPLKVKEIDLFVDLENYDPNKVIIAAEELRRLEIITKEELEEIREYLEKKKDNVKKPPLKEKKDYLITLESIKSKEFKDAEKELFDEFKNF